MKDTKLTRPSTALRIRLLFLFGGVILAFILGVYFGRAYLSEESFFWSFLGFIIFIVALQMLFEGLNAKQSSKPRAGLESPRDANRSDPRA